MPAWMPALVASAAQVVLLVRRRPRAGSNCRAPRTSRPTLAAMEGGPITTVAPSTTATALTSITTGLTPGEHGLIGYRMDVGGDVLNVLRWYTDAGDARRGHEPQRMQPFAPFLGEAVARRQQGRARDEPRSPRRTCAAPSRVGWRAASSLPVVVGQLLRARRAASSTPTTTASTRSPTSAASAPYYDAELRGRRPPGRRSVLDALPPAPRCWSPPTTARSTSASDTSHPSPSVIELRADHSRGEGRFRWLHARPGRTRTTCWTRRPQAHGDLAWVVTPAAAASTSGWFGPVVSPPVAGQARRRRARRRASRSASTTRPTRAVPARLPARVAHIGRDVRAAAAPPA